MKTLVFAYLLAVCYQALCNHEAVVRINARGITGTITFIEVDETTTRVIADLQGLQGEQGWHVHSLPVDQTVSRSEQCLSTWVGPHYDPTGARDNVNYTKDCSQDTPGNCEYGDLAGRLGLLPEDGKLDKVDLTGDLRLEGTNSIVGRSIVIHERGTNDNFECGTIVPREELDGAEVTILQSIFVSPVAGRMYFKQVAGLPDVQIWGKLYYVDNSAATQRHNWHVHRQQPLENYRVGVCAPAGPHFDPKGANASSPGYSNRCTPETPKGCEIGDLTGKLGTVDVAARPANYSTDAFFFTDTYLNLTGFQEIINLSVVVHDPEKTAPRLSCAPLVEAENITLMAFRSKGDSPLATISQYSRYQDTQITLDYLPSLGVPSSLGTDNPDLTIVSAALSPNTPCPLDGRSTPSSDSTYSPFDPVEDVSTPDGSDLGDISNAYGDDVTSCNDFSAFDLPVFGARTTILGRTLRYTYANRRECGALLPPTDGEYLVRARASYSGREIGGNIYFLQNRVNDVVTGSTFIIVDIYYIAEDRRTSTHNWHIHKNASVAGQECAGVIDGHYNPFSVSLEKSDGLNSDYSVDCTGNYQLRCESGDMSGKHGQLEIVSGSDANRPTFTYVDNNLELGGTYSIVGRSVGLHEPVSAGGNLFDCATVKEFSISETVIVSSVRVEDMTNRVAFAEDVARDVTSPNNILILNQRVVGDCVETTMKVTGDTQSTADSTARMVASRVRSQFNSCEADKDDDRECPVPVDGGATFTLLSLPLLLLLLLPSFLLTLT